jgi:hypothetical protein
MIFVESKRKSLKNLKKKYPKSEVIDITSKGHQPFVRFSPFYPHGKIPIPYSENKYSMSVEGIWQGLKVFKSEGIDKSKFFITNMRGIKRTERRFGKVLGHQKGIFSDEILDYKTARKEIYLRTYAWVLDNILNKEINELKDIALKSDLILLDFETNLDIENLNKSLSHAGLVKKYLEKKFPELVDIKFTKYETEKKPKLTKKAKMVIDQIPKIKKRIPSKLNKKIGNMDNGQIELFNSDNKKNS